MKGNMQNKPKKKEEKKESKVHDLKPTKDPKGGIPPGPCGPGVHGSSGGNLPAVQKLTGSN
jgi:hypothetical protein